MRKLLMTVLALALILGSISVASAASGKVKLTDIADNVNEEAIQVSYDLGIVTGTPEGAYEPAKAVNRAEFAALIARALAIPESALSSYTSTTFKDTSGYGWAVPYLAFCQQKGIMKGDGYGNAMPGRTISPNEAVTMILRAIGYTDNASVLVGQWPANYVSLGQSFLIYNNVSTATQLDKANAAQMIYNGLTVQLVQVDANSTVTSLWDDQNTLTRQLPRTLLTAGLDCRYVGKRVVTYEDARASKINLTPKVGAYGVLYVSNKDNEVVALTEVETEFIAGKFAFTSTGKADTYKGLDGITYNLSEQAKKFVNDLNDGSVTDSYIVNSYSSYAANPYLTQYQNTYGYVNNPYYINTSGGAINYFVNGDDHPGFGNSSTTEHYPRTYLNNPKEANNNAGDPGTLWADAAHTVAQGVPSKLIVAAKVNGKMITELRSVAVWDADLRGDTFLYETDQIEGKKFNGHDFPLDYNDEVDEYGYVLAGVDKLDDLAADNVVYVYKNQANKIARVDVGTAVESGVITNQNVKDTEWTIGGKVLKVAPYTGDNIGDMEVNNEGSALLDLYGRIYDFHLSDASKGDFALIVNHGSDGFTANQSAIIKLFDKEGKETTHNITKDLEKRLKRAYAVARTDNIIRPHGVYGGLGWSDVAADALNALDSVKIVAAIGDASALEWRYPKASTYPYLVGYKLAGSRLDSLTNGTRVFEANSEGDYATINKPGTIIKVHKDPNGGGLARDYLIDAGAVVFIVNNSGDFSLGGLGDIQDSELKHSFQYITDSRTHKVKALVINEDDAGAQNVFVMISNITYQSDGAGGNVAQVHGLSFTDGVGAQTKTWLTNSSVGTLTGNLDALRNAAGLGTGPAYKADGVSPVPGAQGSGTTTPIYAAAQPNFYWPEMVKFRVGEDNVLRTEAGRLSLLAGDYKDKYDGDNGMYYGVGLDGQDRITNLPSYVQGSQPLGVYFREFGTGGVAGSKAFYVNYATGSAVSYTGFAVFDSDTVFYSLGSGNTWTAERANSGSFNAAETNARAAGRTGARYIFLKTDPKDFAYDVIIRVDNVGAIK